MINFVPFIGPILRIAIYSNDVKKIAETIIKNPNGKKWIISECQRLYKECKKEHRGLKDTIPDNVFFTKNNDTKRIESFGQRIDDNFGNIMVAEKCGKYDLLWIGNDETIRRVWVFFYDPTTDTSVKASLRWPTKKELQKFFDMT